MCEPDRYLASPQPYQQSPRFGTPEERARAELFLNWFLADLPPLPPVDTNALIRTLRRHRASRCALRVALVLTYTGACLWIGCHL